MLNLGTGTDIAPTPVMHPAAAQAHSNLVSAGKVPDFRITGRAQFLIGTVTGYMNMKFRYTEFQYR